MISVSQRAVGGRPLGLIGRETPQSTEVLRSIAEWIAAHSEIAPQSVSVDHPHDPWPFKTRSERLSSQNGAIPL